MFATKSSVLARIVTSGEPVERLADIAAHLEAVGLDDAADILGLVARHYLVGDAAAFAERVKQIDGATREGGGS